MTAWLVRVVGTLAFLAVAAIAGLIGWARETSQSDPAAVLRLFPAQADALIARGEELREQGRVNGEDVTALGARLLRSSPLSEAPLVFFGLSRSAAGDEVRAREAFSAAARRQPRNIPASIWLAADAIQKHEYAVAATLLERLHRLDNARSNVFAAVWAETVVDPKGAAVLEARLASGSVLARATLRVVNSMFNDFDLLIRLNKHVPGEQTNIVRRLMSQRGPSLAFLGWLEFAPAAEIVDFSWPFDPAFDGSLAPGPFNWTLSRGAELLKQGGLFVRYSGKGSAPLAEQMMLLAPGEYTFKAEMQGNSDEASAGFEWVLRCHSDGPTLIEIVASGLARNTKDFTSRFVVPAQTCGAQILQLRGHTGEFPVRASATVLRVSIQPELASSR